MASFGRIFFVSLSFALFLLALLFLLAIANWLDDTQSILKSLLIPYWKPEAQKMYFLLAQIVLFGWIYGLVVYIWRRNSLEYIDTLAVVPPQETRFVIKGDHVVHHQATVLGRFPFLHFNVPPYNAHGAGRVLALTSTISMVLIWSMLGYVLYTHLAPDGSSYFPGILFPIAAFGIVVLFVVVPFVPPFWNTRLSLGAVIGQVLVAAIWPFWGVSFVHVIVGDLMTSASTTLVLFEWMLCYLISGVWLNRSPTPAKGVCSSDVTLHGDIMEVRPLSHLLHPIMLALPFWIRFVQCIYKVYETRSQGWQWSHTSHYVNAGKYFSAILVVVASLLDSTQKGVRTYRILWIISLVVKTVYCYIWDIYMDWDLGKFPKKSQLTEKSPLINEASDHEDIASQKPGFPRLLRRRRLIPYTWLYYFAMVSNLFMRFSWSIALSPHVNLPPAWSLLMALVEIIRRGQWMIFRLENEHLQNQKKRRNVSLFTVQRSLPSSSDVSTSLLDE